jgi:hypothetical protein
VAGDTAPAGAAQPGVGDGAQAQQDQGNHGNLPWNLDDHPEELRPYLAAELRKIEGGVTQRFQEAAEFRRQMEPLSPLAEIEGLSEVPPEDLAGLVEFHRMAQDPEAFEQWWEQVGDELGLFGDSDEGGAEGAEDGEEPPAWAQELVNRLDQLEGGFQERAQTESERDTLAQIESELADLKKANSDLPWDDEEAAVEDRVCQLAMSYGEDPDALKKGLADYRAITGAGQAALVDAAERGPAPALTGGNGNTAPEEVKGFDDAKSLAKARFAGAR